MFVDHGSRSRASLLRRLPLARLPRAEFRAYLAEARTLARRGGGNLWLAEAHGPAERLPELAAAVARHLASHGVRTGDVQVLAGSTTARIRVLAR